MINASAKARTAGESSVRGLLSTDPREGADRSRRTGTAILARDFETELVELEGPHNRALACRGEISRPRRDTKLPNLDNGAT
jgi:hypothetical protein